MTSASSSGEWRNGWRVVTVAALGTGFAATHAISLGSFMRPLQAEFGWGRSEISACLLIGSIGTIFLSPFLGAAIDRIGARRIALFGVWAYAVSVAGLGLVAPTLGGWYLGWAFIAAFSLGVSPIIWTLAVASRFDAQRGLALAVTLAGLNVATALLPYLSVRLIEALGWRQAYGALAGCGLAIVFPLAVLWFHDARDLQRRNAPQAATRNIASGMTLLEAIRTSLFWRIIASLVLVGASVQALSVHFQPMLIDAGISASDAALVAGVLGPVALVSRLATGFLLDRYPAPIIAAIAFALPIASCLLLLNFNGDHATAMAAIALMGMALGAEVDLIAYLASRYFGMRSYGVIYGVVFGLFAAGWGVMPIIAGAVYDRTGSYDMAIIAMIAMLASSAVLAAGLGPYPKFANMDASEANNDLPDMLSSNKAS